MELTIEQALQQGVAAHKADKLQKPNVFIELSQSPKASDANHNLGVLAVSIKVDAALPLFKTLSKPTQR